MLEDGFTVFWTVFAAEVVSDVASAFWHPALRHSLQGHGSNGLGFRGSNLLDSELETGKGLSEHTKASMGNFLN